MHVVRREDMWGGEEVQPRRTQRQMELDGRWGAEEEVAAIVAAKRARGLWRPHPDAPSTASFRCAQGVFQVLVGLVWALVWVLLTRVLDFQQCAVLLAPACL